MTRDDSYDDEATPNDARTDVPVPVEGPKGEAPPWIDDYRYEKIDASLIDGIDDGEHDLGCSCGCKGEAVVIADTDSDGAYIASTMNSVRYLGSRV